MPAVDYKDRINYSSDYVEVPVHHVLKRPAESRSVQDDEKYINEFRLMRGARRNNLRNIIEQVYENRSNQGDHSPIREPRRIYPDDQHYYSEDKYGQSTPVYQSKKSAI